MERLYSIWKLKVLFTKKALHLRTDVGNIPAMLSGMKLSSLQRWLRHLVVQILNLSLKNSFLTSPNPPKSISHADKLTCRNDELQGLSVSVCVWLGGTGEERSTREVILTLIWRILCQTWIRQKDLNISKKKQQSSLKMDEVENQCQASDILTLQGTLLCVYSSFNCSSQTLCKGVIAWIEFVAIN